MPLRSVEAATRDDAIAAAREQFGPQARVVGVRRVRSGGVLGFFATERYVAEVAPDAAGRPPVPGAGRAPVDPAATPSPLASAAPARARSTAPARNGAAAYAALASTPAEFPARREPEEAPPRSSAILRAAEKRADEARLGELARLLGTSTEPPEPVYSRASFPRATTAARPVRDLPTPSLVDDDIEDDDIEDDDVEDDDLIDEDRTHGPAVIASHAPSPFTAALARMVSGDRDVRQAVEQALEPPASSPSGALAEPWPTWSAPVRTAEPSVPSPPARQKEETVGNQVIAPPSMPAARPAELPTWDAEPEPQAPIEPRIEIPTEEPSGLPAEVAPSREEAIAEVLRSALAQGHSDEALAGILRKVLAGASPQTALSEPEPVVAAPDLPNLVAELPEPTETAPVAPIDELSVDTSVGIPVIAPAAHQPAAEPPVAGPVDVPAAAPLVVPAAPLVVPVVPVVPVVAAEPLPAPAPIPSAPRPMWGEPVSDLWSAPVPPPSAPARADAPIWADVVLHGPATPEAPAEVETVVEDDMAEDVMAQDDVVEDAVAEDAVAEDAVAEDAVAEDAVAEEAGSLIEVAPLLARTASDPAPISLDATTVMPPLSLLPPLPGMRGRGRPPVPPVMSRPPAASAPAPVVHEAEATPEAARNLATVTRLPIAPLLGTPAVPAAAELDDLAEALESLAVDLPAEPTAPAPAPVEDVAPPPVAPAPVVPAPAPRIPELALPARPALPARTTPAEPGDVVAQLTALGLPAELLGAGFASDVAVQGTYAALTRALGLRLPPAPELPLGAGEVLFVVGPGVETLRAARSLAATLRLDPERVQWATRGDLAGLAPESSRMDTIDAAIDRRQAAAGAGTVTIVAVDAPMRTDAYWMAQMLAIWSPVAVWAVVEATRKPEDLEPWLDGLSRVDALIVQDTDLSADPAAVLRRVAAPVALLDGVRATPHRWASLLCERLEDAQA